MSFNIVEFMESKMVDVVPTTWLFRGNEILQYYWPTYKASRLKKAIILEEDLSGDCWSLFNIKIIKTFETCDDARKKLGLAEDTDNLDSARFRSCQTRSRGRRGEEGGRSPVLNPKKFPAKRPLDSSSSEEEEETSRKTKKCLPNIEFPTKIITNNEAHSQSLPGLPTQPTNGFSTDQSKDCLQKILNRLETLCAVQEQHSIVLQELMTKIFHSPFSSKA